MAPRPRQPRRRREDIDPKAYLADWQPKTELGRKVQAKEITDIDQILDNGLRVLEPEIADTLLDLESELILIGQSKGKFGGGQRRVFRQTQKKTMEGNKPTFSAYAVVGNKDGYIGLGLGKSKETIPAREKAVRNAKLALFKIRRGAGSWEDSSSEPHSIPFAVEGKCGSVVVKLMPAPKGKGLVVEKEMAKILALAGIKDCWARTRGQSKNKVNLVKAVEQALKRLSKMKVKHDQIEQFSIIEGRTPKKGAEAEEATPTGEDA
ncbi:30S ribosomal protein S5 [Candidatus Woesearchaeota archaeon]|nr:30S ribosomal protein S5 [Candidatus Woesearchaeota archaeon]